LRHGQVVQTPWPRPWLMMDFVFPSTCVEIKFRAPHAIDARLPPFLRLLDGVQVDLLTV
jgi:hypothetical protein